MLIVPSFLLNQRSSEGLFGQVWKKSLVDRRTAVGDQSNSSDVTLVSTVFNIRLHLNFKTHIVKYKNVLQSAVFPDVTTTQIYFIQIKNSGCFCFRIAWNWTVTKNLDLIICIFQTVKIIY